MEDTIIVRPSGLLQRTNHGNVAARIVEVEDDDETERSYEDRLVVRTG